MNREDPLHAVRGIVFAVPVSIALWVVILLAVGWAAR
jgi:nitrogen fixation-related uncharacterized protein